MTSNNTNKTVHPALVKKTQKTTNLHTLLFKVCHRNLTYFIFGLIITKTMLSKKTYRRQKETRSPLKELTNLQITKLYYHYQSTYLNWSGWVKQRSKLCLSFKTIELVFKVKTALSYFNFQ